MAIAVAPLDDRARPVPRSARGRRSAGPSRTSSRPARRGSASWPAARARGVGRARRRPAVVAPGRSHRPGPRRSARSRSPRARRRASRSATRRRSPRRVDAGRCAPRPRCCCSPPRRSPRTSSRALVQMRRAPSSSPPPTTATPRRRSARGSAATPTWCSPTPRCCTSACCPHHARWATFFMRLRYVVVDELHMLRGIFGTHVAHLLRRLRRICAHYGSDPDLRLLVGHHRHAGRVGLGSVRQARRRGHRRRFAARRAAVRVVEPRRRRPAAPHARRPTARRRAWSPIS